MSQNIDVTFSLETPVFRVLSDVIILCLMLILCPSSYIMFVICAVDQFLTNWGCGIILAISQGVYKNIFLIKIWGK